VREGGSTSEAFVHPSLASEFLDHPNPGVEWDWLAVDERDRVALFSTAGYATVPSAVLERSAEMDVAVDAIFSEPSRDGRSVDETGHWNLPWHKMASWGLYVYDWSHWEGPYARAAVPSNPVRVEELPQEARTAALHVRFPTSFATTHGFAAPRAKNAQHRLPGSPG
jgi:hypothetical protein